MNICEREYLKHRCCALRHKGYSLNHITQLTGLPKTTAYGYIKDIVLTEEQKQEIAHRKKELLRRPSPKKGKCIQGRSITRPGYWSRDLVSVVAHFIFDGSIGSDTCAYYNRSESQISDLKTKISALFRTTPKQNKRPDGVWVLSYYNVELARYMSEKAKEIFLYLENEASQDERRAFLKAFFDDEGNVYYAGNTRRVRGYQKSADTLKHIEKLLKEFDINCNIHQRTNAVEITGKENLKKFAEEIGFSRGIVLNPLRTNSMWKRSVEKREVLDMALVSYLK